MRLYWTAWGPQIREAYRMHRVPPEVMLTIIATENGPGRRDPDGQPVIRPPRTEPGYRSDDATPHRISVGPCHVLISTARQTLGMPQVDRAWLSVVANNLRAAASYVADGVAVTKWDPILVCARFNAGGLYDSSASSQFHNRWHLRSWGDHLDRAADWYGDAVAVLAESVETEPAPEGVPVEVVIDGTRWAGEVRRAG